jgi:5,10-methylenetetrahydromethanopterin reductase
MFGVTRPATDPLEAVEFARFVEACGFDLIGMGDSQLRWGDCYVVLGAISQVTSSIRLGTFITNPLTRHPSVLASAARALQEVSQGRAFLGIGHGETASRDVGVPRLRVDAFGEAISAIRSLSRGEEVTYQGRTWQMKWSSAAAPIWVAADGPRMLQLAGRIADGVIVGNGSTPELVRYARNQVAIGAAAAGRDASTIPIYWMVRVVPAASESDGWERLRFYMATYANTRYQLAAGEKGIPVDDDIMERLEGFRSEYRYGEGLRPELGFNADLVDKYGLREWLGRQFAITGPIDHCIERLKELIQAGATNFMLPQMFPDVRATTQELADHILPAFR